MYEFPYFYEINFKPKYSKGSPELVSRAYGTLVSEALDETASKSDFIGGTIHSNSILLYGCGISDFC